MWGYPQTCLKLGGRVTQTSGIDSQINQSAHDIYHITDN